MSAELVQVQHVLVADQVVVAFHIEKHCKDVCITSLRIEVRCVASEPGECLFSDRSVHTLQSPVQSLDIQRRAFTGV